VKRLLNVPSDEQATARQASGRAMLRSSASSFRDHAMMPTQISGHIDQSDITHCSGSG
jgi:hypothetical protein